MVELRGYSKEYEEFLKGEAMVKKLSLYEKLCNISEKLLPIPPWKDLTEKYHNAIYTCHCHFV